jgi:hypothetical protein
MTLRRVSEKQSVKLGGSFNWFRIVFNDGIFRSISDVKLPDSITTRLVTADKMFIHMPYILPEVKRKGLLCGPLC